MWTFSFTVSDIVLLYMCYYGGDGSGLFGYVNDVTMAINFEILTEIYTP